SPAAGRQPDHRWGTAADTRARGILPPACLRPALPRRASLRPAVPRRALPAAVTPTAGIPAARPARRPRCLPPSPEWLKVEPIGSAIGEVGRVDVTRTGS